MELNIFWEQLVHVYLLDLPLVLSRDLDKLGKVHRISALRVLITYFNLFR